MTHLHACAYNLWCKALSIVPSALVARVETLPAARVQTFTRKERDHSSRPPLQATPEVADEEPPAMMCWPFTGADIHICVDNISFVLELKSYLLI